MVAKDVRFGGVLAALFTVFWLLAGVVQPAAAAQGQEVEPTPAIWKLEHEGATIWIYGTFHLLKPGTPYSNEIIDAAFNASKTLVTEAKVDEAVVTGLVAKYGMADKGDAWIEQLSQEELVELEKLSKSLGLPVQILKTFKPWMAALALTQTYISKLGYSSEAGVESRLYERADAVGMARNYLETAEEQIRMFADLDKDMQLLMMKQTIEELNTMPEMLETMLKAWMTGDIETLADTLHESISQYPDLEEKLLLRRNRNWAEQVEKFVGQGGTIFLAVGAGHLVGKENLVELLRDKGFTVTRQ